MQKPTIITEDRVMKRSDGHGARVTLKDIATDTGYSITAVSHALNNRSDISEAAKERIRDSACRLGYLGNGAAAALQTGVTRTIAVLVCDMANPHFAFMSKIIETQLRENNYSCFFMNTDENEKIELQCLQLALRQNVDGLIWCPVQASGSVDNLRLVQASRVPFVLIGRHFPGETASCVRLDDEKAGFLVGRHLMEKGHFNTVFLNTSRTNSSSAERLAGFVSAYDRSPVPLKNRVVSFDEDGRYMGQLLTAQKTWAEDAVVAFNDLIAWDVMTRARQLSPALLSALSIAGFDNLHSCLSLPFALTSVSASKVAMPRRAVDILLQQIEHPGMPLSSLTLDVELIDRGSVV